MNAPRGGPLAQSLLGRRAWEPAVEQSGVPPLFTPLDDRSPCREVAQVAVNRRSDIFAAFRANLRDSLARLRSQQAEAEAMLWPDDQQKQRRRDIEAMERRLAEREDDEAREIDAITERYAEVKPHATAAAVVFALTREDAKGGLT